MNTRVGCFAFLSFCLLSAAHAEQAAVVNANRVNVRGQPTLRSEVVTQLVEGDKVEILEEIPDTDAKTNEPSTWAKIKLPENTPVWVFAPFIKDNEVTVSRLNLRSGPGENYSVVGRVERGDKVNPIRTVESWIEITAPDDSYAFVALNLLQATAERSDSGSTAAQATSPGSTPTEVASTPATPGGEPTAATGEQASSSGSTNVAAVASTEFPEKSASADGDATASANAEQEPGAAPETAAVQAQEATTPGETSAAQPEIAATPDATLPQVAEPVNSANATRELRKRIVRREGIVRPTRSIQAPTPYALIHPETGMTINYLYGADIGVNVAEFRDMKVVVAGQEGLDARWPKTPVLQLESIDTAP